MLLSCFLTLPHRRDVLLLTESCFDVHISSSYYKELRTRVPMAVSFQNHQITLSLGWACSQRVSEWICPSPFGGPSKAKGSRWFQKKRKKNPGNKHVVCGCNHLNKTRQKPCWVLCASSSTRNKLSLWETSQSSITRWHVLLALMISWLKSAGHEQNSVNTSKERAEAQDNACCGSLWIVLSVS